MEKLSGCLEIIQKHVMTQWLCSLPGFDCRKNEKVFFESENYRFENPLYYHVSHEFQTIYEFMRSQDLSIEAPVAETWIKFKILNSRDEAEVTGYPVLLKDSILQNIVEIYTPSEGDLEILFKRIDQLIEKARQFLVKTRDSINTIKMREMQSGIFSDESLGSPAASCPSSGM